jgi:hypothetical protein
MAKKLSRAKTSAAAAGRADLAVSISLTGPKILDEPIARKRG